MGIVTLFLTLWHYVVVTLKKLWGLTIARFSSPSNIASRKAKDNVYLADLTIEVFPDTGQQISSEAQLFVDFILSTGGETIVRTLGPFTRESDWKWRSSERVEIDAKMTSVKLVGYIREASNQRTLRFGSTKIEDGRLVDMRLGRNQRWSNTLRDEDDQPTTNIMAYVVNTSEEDQDDIRSEKLDMDTVGSATHFPRTSWRRMKAILFSPDGQSDEPGQLFTLGITFQRRFEQTGDLGDIEKAIKNLQQTVSLIPDGHSDKAARLAHLGDSFNSRFEHTGMLSDIEDAIQNHRRALLLTPVGHLHKPARLSDLGNSLRKRFEQIGVLIDIDEAINNQRQAVFLTPDGHPDKPSWLNDLGDSLRSRFECTGVLDDIAEAIKNLQQAVFLTPDGHPAKPARFSNLGRSLQSRFKHTWVLSEIDEAIRHFRQAVSLTPDGHPHKPSRFNNLGNSLWNRFRRTRVLGDVEEAIEYQRDAVVFIPDGHADKPAFLNDLGKSLNSRFECTSALDDVEEAIVNLQRAVFLTPDGHSQKPERLSNLGNSLRSRFQQTRILSDIEDAIKNLQQAVLLTPDGHSDKPTWLSDLGISFDSRFERTGVLGDIDEAIMNHQRALLLTPDGHPQKLTQLSNLGSSFRRRFGWSRVLSDLEEAIKSKQQAVLLIPDGHPDKPGLLSDLAKSLQNRFEQTKAFGDIDEAIRNFQQALSLTPDGRYDKPARLFRLGRALQTRFGCSKVSGDFREALSHFETAALSRSGSPLVRFKASRQWARLIARRDPSSALEAYRRAIELIPHIAWIGDPISVRHSLLTQFEDLSREASAFALSAGNSDLALEWLEQGRLFVQSQIFKSCSSDEGLHKAHPDLYEEFSQTSGQLREAAVRERRAVRSFDISISLEEQTRHHQRLMEEWHSLVDQIRSIPSFEDFLLPKKASSLKKAAESGPVVTINVHKRRCDALVLVQGADGVQHIPLNELSFEGVEEMLEWLKQDLAGYPDIGEHVAFKSRDLHLEKILSLLFSKAVRPILHGLDMMRERTDPSDLPRIWWCPTGPLAFFPLHAACVNVSGGRDDVSNYAISSYIPTVNSLLEARARTRPPCKQLLGIAMMDSPPHHLSVKSPPDGQTELETIRKLFRAGSTRTFKALGNEEATRERVLADVANSSWVHFSCQAVDDAQKPTQSGFLLHDGRLTITDLISKRFDNADLAFLSACQTAIRDEKPYDEAVWPIMAAMLGAGFRSVIGTMWSTPDDVAPILAVKVYKNLLSGQKPDSERAAWALHGAVKDLQKSGNHSFYSLVPFVHYGI